MFRRQSEKVRQSDKVEALSAVPLFSDLGKRYLGLLARHSEETDVPAGHVIVRQGERGHQFMLLRVGTARVERDGVAMAHLGPGDFFGEMSLIDGKPRSASVIAESACSLLTIDQSALIPLLDTVPGLQRRMLIALCARIRALQELLV